MVFSCVHIKQLLGILGGGFPELDLFNWKFVFLVLIKGKKLFGILKEVRKDFKIANEEIRNVISCLNLLSMSCFFVGEVEAV